MFWMRAIRAYPLRGQVGGGWALEIESFLGPVKWLRADRRVPFGAQKTRTYITLFNTASSAAPQFPLCRKRVLLKPDCRNLLYWQSDTKLISGLPART